jgi:hypothetical protein
VELARSVSDGQFIPCSHTINSARSRPTAQKSRLQKIAVEGRSGLLKINSDHQGQIHDVISVTYRVRIAHVSAVNPLTGA